MPQAAYETVLAPLCLFIKKEAPGGKQRVGNLPRLSTDARQSLAVGNPRTRRAVHTLVVWAGGLSTAPPKE